MIIIAIVIVTYAGNSNNNILLPARRPWRGTPSPPTKSLDFINVNECVCVYLYVYSICIYIYIYVYMMLRLICINSLIMSIWRPGEASLRPVHLLRVWISEGLTQASS